MKNEKLTYEEAIANLVKTAVESELKNSELFNEAVDYLQKSFPLKNVREDMLKSLRKPETKEQKMERFANSQKDFLKKHLEAHPECKVVLTDEDIERAMNFGKNADKEKSKEGLGNYKVDGRAKKKRFTNGLLGEMMVFKFLGIPVEQVEDNVGNSNNFRHGDLEGAGYNISVKTSLFGYAAMVYEKPEMRHDEVIVILDSRDKTHKTGYVCGLARKDILKYSDIDLVGDRMNLNNDEWHRKVGFYAYDKLEWLDEELIESLKK